jgi:hypothetical protein
MQFVGTSFKLPEYHALRPWRKALGASIVGEDSAPSLLVERWWKDKFVPLGDVCKVRQAARLILRLLCFGWSR